MVNKELYLRKIAMGDPDQSSYMPMDSATAFHAYVTPSWKTDKNVLKKHDLVYDPRVSEGMVNGDGREDYWFEHDSNPFYINEDINHMFDENGEKSGLIDSIYDHPDYKERTPYNTTKRFPQMLSGLAAMGLGAYIADKEPKLENLGVAVGVGGLGYSAYHAIKDSIDEHQHYKNFKAIGAANNKLKKNLTQLQDAYMKDYQSRYDQAITPAVYKKIQKAYTNRWKPGGYEKYYDLISKSVKPYVRDYSKQKLAAIF